MFLTEGSNFTRMKNKYLTRSLCVTILSAMVLSSPMSVMAADEHIETASDLGDGSGEVISDGSDTPDTPAPEPVQEAEETLAAEESEAESTPVTAQTDKADANDITASEHKSVDEQIREMRTEGISSTVKMLLIIGGAMLVVLIGLLIALHFKNS